MRIRSGDVVALFPFERIGSGFRRVEFRLEGLKPPVDTFEMRVFVDEAHPDAGTQTHGNPHSLGSQFFYGLGVPDGRSERTQVRLNITAGVRAYLEHTSPHTAPVALVAVDRHGKEIPEPDLDFEGISIVSV